jgi:protein arginine kinase activator
MKCQQCDKQAVFHITELEGGAVRELHLCEDHARVYLNQSEAGGGPAAGPGEGGEGKPAAGGLIGPLGVGQTADELALLDQKACDMCGITFFEFRNQGRLGCPHDYVHFEKELEPLIANIHGATQHTGRTPSRAGAGEAAVAAGGRGPLPVETDELTGVIGLRRGMKEAIACEDYEKARENRDAIRAIEERWLGAAPGPVPPAAGGEPAGQRQPPTESGAP